MKKAQKLLITLRQGEGGATRQLVWDGKRPLPIGYPASWVLERADAGVRLRRIDAPAGEVVQGAFSRIGDDELARGGVTRQAGAHTLRIEAPRTLTSPARAKAPAGAGRAIYLHLSLGDWVAESVRLGGASARFSARLGEEEIFTVSRQSSGWKIEPIARIARVFGPAREGLSDEQLLSCSVACGKHLWTFSAAQDDESLAPVIPIGLGADPEKKTFRRVLVSAAAALLLLLTLLSSLEPLAPQPEKKAEAPALPPQYAKVVVKQRVQGSRDAKPNAVAPEVPKAAKVAAGGPAASGAPGKHGPKSSEGMRAVGRNRSLENLVSGLVKGGMTKFVNDVKGTGQGAGQVGELLGKNGLATHVGGNGKGGSLSVGSVDVKGVGGQGISPVGYATGDRARVAGQGKGFVASGDGNDAVIDEGLTKAEVGAVIRKHWNQIRYCYSSAGLRAPNLDARLVVAFAINAQGRVAQSAVSSSTRKEQYLENCLLRLIDTMQFPHPRGGKMVNVDYPFVFRMLGRDQT